MIMENYSVNFRGLKCSIHVGRYPTTDQIYIKLVDREGGTPVATASVALKEYDSENDEVLNKSYLENEGMAQALVDAKVISKSIKVVPAGISSVTLHKLLDYGKYGL